MFFYLILLGMYCQVFAVLGLGNKIRFDTDVEEEGGDSIEDALRRFLAKKGGGGGSGSKRGIGDTNGDSGDGEIHDTAGLDVSAKDY